MRTRKSDRKKTRRKHAPPKKLAQLQKVFDRYRNNKAKVARYYGVHRRTIGRWALTLALAKARQDAAQAATEKCQNCPHPFHAGRCNMCACTNYAQKAGTAGMSDSVDVDPPVPVGDDPDSPDARAAGVTGARGA